jgi:putative tricarboxylic transport membrane protein
LEILQQILGGFGTILNPVSLLAIIAGVSVGVVVGCLPGLSGTMAVAIMVPLTFSMNAQVGIVLLLGVFVGAIYGGSISAILIGTPGTPGNIVTVFDGYTLAQQGHAGRALYTALLFSVVGGLLSAICLMTAAPLLAKVALKFGPREYFGLTLFGISVISSISGKSLVKGVTIGLLGMALSTVGLDTVSGVARFTFGTYNLVGGFDLMAVLIGFFAVGEVLSMSSTMPKDTNIRSMKVEKIQYGLKQYRGHWLGGFRSAIIGTVIGVIPGAGAAIASFVSYDVAKRSSKEPEKFGSGHIPGIIAAESANNATTGGALIPMMTLGIPGDPVTAVLIGAFLIQGLTPGPLLFVTSPQVVYSLIAGFFIANIVMFGVGILGIRVFSRISKVPRYIIAPSIIALCMIGAWGIRNNIFDVGIMLIMGVLGYFTKKNGYPSGPFVIGFILGPLFERSLRQALTASHGSWGTFLESPLSLAFIIITLATFVFPLIKDFVKRNKSKKQYQ